MHAANDINARRVDNLFLITRGNIIPAVAKLTHEQAAAFMVLGQSMESSAGDPTQAGTIKNEFFYDPFIAGDRSEHANLFYDILQANPHINCYLLNTGWVGEGDSYKDITLADTMGILDSLLRGGAEDWHLSHADRAGDPALDPRGRFRSSCGRKSSSRPPTSTPGSGPSTASGPSTWTTIPASTRRSRPSSRPRPRPSASLPAAPPCAMRKKLGGLLSPGFSLGPDQVFSDVFRPAARLEKYAGSLAREIKPFTCRGDALMSIAEIHRESVRVQPERERLGVLQGKTALVTGGIAGDRPRRGAGPGPARRERGRELPVLDRGRPRRSLPGRRVRRPRRGLPGRRFEGRRGRPDGANACSTSSATSISWSTTPASPATSRS